MQAGSQREARLLIYPLFIPNAACPGRCIFCDQKRISGAGELSPDYAEQIKHFVERNPGVDKQIAFYGGTFTALEQAARDRLISPILPLLDQFSGLRISTHPLYVENEQLDWCRVNRVRTIELGIQDFADQVLEAAGRGYNSAQAMQACRRVQEAGFEMGVQLMPGLPGADQSTLALNRERLAQIKPDTLRLYPLIVIKGTPLEELYLDGKYVPLSMEEAIMQCADYVDFCQEQGIKLIKLGIPSNLDIKDIIAGPYHAAFGEFVKAELLVRKIVLDFEPESPIILSK